MYYARNNPLLYVDSLGEDYNIFDKDGSLIGQAKDQKDLEGYVLERSENGGNLLIFEGGYRAEYFEGAAATPVQAKDDSGMTPVARGVLTELDRSASGSLELIGGFAAVTTAGGLIGGVAAFVAPGALPFIVQAAQKVSVTGPSAAISLLAKAQDAKLRNFIKDLYRVAAKIGSGSTADAIRYERLTGKLLSPAGHSIKGQGSINGLEKLIRSGRLNDRDTEIAKYLINDLKNAMR